MPYTAQPIRTSRNGQPRATPRLIVGDAVSDHAASARTDVSPAAPAPVPGDLVLTGAATTQLRAYLAARGLGQWGIYCCNTADFHDLDGYLADLGEADDFAPHDAGANGGEQPASLDRDPAVDGPAAVQRAGFHRLRRHDVVVARWVLFDVRHHAWCALHLLAAPTPEHVVRLRRDLARIQRERSRGKWRVYNGNHWEDADDPRAAGADWGGLVLDPAIKRRLEAEVVSFFREPVARMYKDLDIPYRRGLLLYGPPGNGKTSLIRVIGGLNPDVPCLLLRPGEDFTDGEMTGFINYWRDQAPAILVIEDLDWLFHSARVNVSTFLNMLDGVDRRDGGLLLVATSNHPESLDPAINNRPGRFDVAIEVTCPDRDLRREFFRRSRLAIDDAGLLDDLVARTDGLSFSHLREVESLSGLHALQGGRSARTPADLRWAADVVAEGYERAKRGFPEPAGPFGLGQLRGRGRKGE